MNLNFLLGEFYCKGKQRNGVVAGGEVGFEHASLSSYTELFRRHRNRLTFRSGSSATVNRGALGMASVSLFTMFENFVRFFAVRFV